MKEVASRFQRERQAEEREAFRQEMHRRIAQMEAQCAKAFHDAALEPIDGRTSMKHDPTEMSVAMRSDPDRMQPEESVAVLGLERAINECGSARDQVSRRYGLEQIQRLDREEKGKVVDALVRLFSGETTWGQFNSARVIANRERLQNYERFLSEARKEQEEQARRERERAEDRRERELDRAETREARRQEVARQEQVDRMMGFLMTVQSFQRNRTSCVSRASFGTVFTDCY